MDELERAEDLESQITALDASLGQAADMAAARARARTRST